MAGGEAWGIGAEVGGRKGEELAGKVNRERENFAFREGSAGSRGGC